jgi:hypothetical protein
MKTMDSMIGVDPICAKCLSVFHEVGDWQSSSELRDPENSKQQN